MLLLVINVILLFVGSVLEPPAAILLLTPLLTPIAYAAGVDPIHFGIIVTVNLAIGMFMPPFGLNLFAAQRAVQDAAAGALSRRHAVPCHLSGHADADHLRPGDHAGAADAVPVKRRVVSGGETPR